MQLTHNAQFTTGNNGRDFPPSYTEWTEDNEKYSYYDCMYVGVDCPNGYVIGQIATYASGDNWSISGDTTGLAIDSATGVITLSDNTLLTTEETRYITVERYIVGEVAPQSVTLPVYVVDDSSDVGFYSPDGDDANDGRQPHKPRQTFASAITYANRRDKMLFLRGATFNGAMAIRGDRLWASYGNPLAHSPTIVYDDSTSLALNQTYDSCIHTQRKSDDTGFQGIENAVINDFILDGNGEALVLLENQSSANYSIKRIHVKNNGENANSSAVRCRDNADGGVIRHITSEDNQVYGEAVYCTKQKTQTALYEIGYCSLGIPLGGAADCIQVTSEDDETQVNYNVWVHNNRAFNSTDSSSTKGAMVIQGCINALVENNELEGKYFGLGVGFKKGVARRNKINQGGLPRTNSNWYNTWGIGGGADDVMHEISIYDNDLTGRINITDEDFLYYGLIIGGFDLTGLDAERYDMEISYNRVDKFAQFFYGNGGVSWSGILTNNITDNNVLGDGTPNTTLIEDDAGLATQGTYLNKIIEQPHVGLFNSQSTVTMYGDTSEGDTLTAILSLSDGETLVSKQWRLNGLNIANANGDEYLIPSGTSSQLYDRMPQISPLNLPEISFVAVVEDANGNRDFVISDYYRVGVDYELSEYIPPDTTAPVITLTPNTTTYNLTVGDTIPSITATTDDGSAVTYSDDVQSVNRTVRTYTSTDTAGNTSTRVVTFNFAYATPTLTLSASTTNASASEQVTITATATNTDTLVFSSSEVTLSGTGNTRTFTAPSLLAPNTVTVNVTATGDGGSITETVTVNVAAYVEPTSNAKLISRTNFSLNDSLFQSFKGRGNVERLRFNIDTGLERSNDNYFDFDANGIVRVEVGVNLGQANESIIDTGTSFVEFENDSLYVELGALTGIGSHPLYVVIYTANDTKGTLIAGPSLKGSSPVLQFM